MSGKRAGGRKDAVDPRPRSAEEYCAWGATFYKQNNFEQAAAFFTKAIKMKPNLASAHYNRGLVHYAVNNFKRAIFDFSRAITMKPDFAKAYCGRGIVHNRAENFDKAIIDCSEAITLKPDYVEAHGERAIAYSETGTFDKAIDDYNTAIRLSPNALALWYNRGFVHWKARMFHKGVDDFSTVLDMVHSAEEESKRYMDDKNYDEFGERIAKASNRSKGNKALGHFNALIKVAPDFVAETYYSRGLCYMARGWCSVHSDALMDFMTAEELGYSIAERFTADFGSAAVFEGKYGVELPNNIKKIVGAKAQVGSVQAGAGQA